jgi:hypothetical protein
VFTVRANRIRVVSARPMSRNERNEREFWSTHDATDYFDFAKSRRVEIAASLLTGETHRVPFDNEKEALFSEIRLPLKLRQLSVVRAAHL